MSDDLAAFEAVFHQVRPVASRKAVQVILEVPIEHQMKVLSVLGGMACHDGSVRVAVARLGKTAETGPDHPDQGEGVGLNTGGARPGTPSPAPEKKPLSLASKVAMTCASPTFHDWLRRHHSDRWLAAFHNARKKDGGGQPRDADAAAEYVRRACGVSSRSEIVLGSDAAAIWGTISVEFEHWQRVGGRAA